MKGVRDEEFPDDFPLLLSPPGRTATTKPDRHHQAGLQGEEAVPGPVTFPRGHGGHGHDDGQSENRLCTCRFRRSFTDRSVYDIFTV